MILNKLPLVLLLLSISIILSAQNIEETDSIKGSAIKIDYTSKKAIVVPPSSEFYKQKNKLDSCNNKNYQNKVWIQNDYKLIPDSVKFNFQTSRLATYEKMLKQYELEKIKNEGGEVEIINSRISTLKAMISLEKNKNIEDSSYVDRPKFIDTGNYQIDIKNYEEAKREWIKNHPEEYKKTIQARKTPEVIEIEHFLKQMED